MAAIPTISLEQWRALVAVVDDGGYAPAAEAIHKSQSTVTYAVQQIEKLLGVKAFRLEGRKAVLTPAGRMLYSRARVLLDEASSLERAAQRNSAGWEAEITIAVEIIFPTWLLLKCLDRFGREAPNTRIEVIETVLGGAPEALLEQARTRNCHRAIDAASLTAGRSIFARSPVDADDAELLLIGRRRGEQQPRIRSLGSQNLTAASGIERVDLALTPLGFSGESLMRLAFVPAAHPNHLFRRSAPHLEIFASTGT